MTANDKKDAIVNNTNSAQAEQKVKNLQDVLSEKHFDLSRFKKLADNREFFIEKKEKLLVYILKHIDTAVSKIEKELILKAE